ncbi:MAG: hypothetical protein KIS87_11960 [Phycisphaeraceae bacterium]|nr:hypothetical protein [Phycisphaeraceae bacterium]
MTVLQLTSRLELWYASQCDGEWEHESGVDIRSVSGEPSVWEIEIDVLPADVGLIQHQEGPDSRVWQHTKVRVLGGTGASGLVLFLQQFLDRFGPPENPQAAPGVLGDDEDPLHRLQAWYVSALPDSDRKVQPEIRIGTLDNPGWHLSIVLPHGSALSKAQVDQYENDADELDWFNIKWSPPVFDACAGPRHLSTIVRTFLSLWHSQG